jgi:4-hydroxy-tetrahydrodipicolinate synthase
MAVSKAVASWSGIFPAALTMFDATGALDEATTATHLERIVGEGAHGVVVGGTSGEFISLTDSERRRLIEVAVEAVAGRIPLVVGTGYFSTAETIRLTCFAEAAGADGAIVILPYYQRPTVDEIVSHFDRIGAATSLPILVYNNPANSAAPPLDTHALAELHAAGRAHGVKSTFPTVHQVHELRASLSDAFRVFYGSFMAPLEGLAGGAHGWISGVLNVTARDAVRLWEAIAIESDLQAARTAWARILPIKRLYTEHVLGPTSDLAIYRGVLRIRGANGGHCRPPLVDLDASQLRTLETYLEEHELDAAAST